MITCYVPDLTTLRYFIPLAEVASESGREVTFIYNRNREKYNGLKNDVNFLRFQEICAENSWLIARDDIGDSMTSNFHFTVENVGWSRVKHDKHLSIQHGFDYVALGSDGPPETVYIAHSKVCADDIMKRHKRESFIPSTPISLWSWEKRRDFGMRWLSEKGIVGKIVTVFYPESGQHDLVRDIVDNLESEGYSCVMKQRTKHQGMRSHGMATHVYDSLWNPSESIFLPLCSELTVGFGSTAYADLVEAGISYVNIDTNRGSPWDDQFLYPHKKESYLSIRNDVSVSIISRLKSFTQEITPSNDQRSFLEEIIS